MKKKTKTGTASNGIDDHHPPNTRTGNMRMKTVNGTSQAEKDDDGHSGLDAANLHEQLNATQAGAHGGPGTLGKTATVAGIIAAMAISVSTVRSMLGSDGTENDAADAAAIVEAPGVHVKLTKAGCPVSAGYRLHIQGGGDYSFSKDGEAVIPMSEAGKRWELFFDALGSSAPSPALDRGIVPSIGEITIAIP